MKRIISFTVAILTALVTVASAAAQTAESIWLTANSTAYKTGETVIVAFSASSTTPIQGFTFQIRYDPSCLKPVNASSAIPGMNGLPLPQLAGLVDGSYASTTPQVVNGSLAEVRFTALKGCQTDLYLEDAVLVFRDAEGFAKPISGVAIGERSVSLNIDKEVGVSNSSQSDSGSILPLDPPKSNPVIPMWGIGLIGLAFVFLFGLVMFGISRLFRSKKPHKKTKNNPSAGIQSVALHIKHGPHAGKSYILNRLPVLIGRDPQNDICINDPHVISRHAQIYSDMNGYYLRDMGGGTSINGHSLKNNAAFLHPGDVVRLGRSVLFVFG